MPYEIKQKGDKFYVVDTADNKIRGTYDNEDSAEDRKDELDFRAHVRSRIDRLPVTEMTAEEKAAAYDKMMAEKDKPTDSHIPPKKDEQEEKDKKPKRRSPYWGTEVDDD
jgi:DNA-directed RNA polymerase delta subunit